MSHESWEIHSWSLFVSSIWPVKTLFLILSGKRKVRWLYYQHPPSKSFFYFCISSTYSSFMEQYAHNLKYWNTFLFIFLLIPPVCIMYICSSMCNYVFPFVYSVLVYYVYTNVDNGPWRVGTRVNIFFFTTNHYNNYVCYIQACGCKKNKTDKKI